MRSLFKTPAERLADMRAGEAAFRRLGSFEFAVMMQQIADAFEKDGDSMLGCEVAFHHLDASTLLLPR